MNAPKLLWPIFALLAVVTLIATGWVSVRVARLEQERIDESRRAKVEENVSLALWRIDSLVAPLVAIENTRPFQLKPTVLLSNEEPRLENRYFTLELLPGGQVQAINGQLPTPLRNRGETSRLIAELPKPTIQLSEPPMLQFGQDQQQTAPMNMPAPLPSKSFSGKGGKAASARAQSEYQARQSTLNRGMMQNYKNPVFNQQRSDNTQPMLPPAQQPQATPSQPSVPQGPPPQSGVFHPPVPQATLLPLVLTLCQAEQSSPDPLVPLQQGYQTQQDLQMQSEPQIQQAASMPIPVQPQSVTMTKEGFWSPMQPVCVDDQLLLLRRVRLGRRSLLQGCVLDWPRLARFLEKEVTDLLPDARLVLDGKASMPGRMLASLPVRLEPGPLPAADMLHVNATLTPVLASVAIAFGCVLLSIGAFAILLLGLIRLGRRRSEFVTAVTHELRTPLTTFRMYSEMLAEGMVEPDSQKSYLQTLEAEADRLTHLVENVLSSARLERGRHTGRHETLPIGELLTPIASRLAKRCQRAEMRLVVEITESVNGTTIQTNPTAVEQILWNLVDNACKYAVSAMDRTIRLTCEVREDQVATITVSDHGPGLPREVRRRLFRGFSKTASEAARSAPGVGLGLALSRRLARDLGGELELVPTAQGASFVLSLRLR